MLAAIGLDRTSAYIANVIPWRPPGNRTPTPHETEICRPFIERQIELVNPKVLVNLGGPSAKILLNTTEGILRLRGNWRVHTTAPASPFPPCRRCTRPICCATPRTRSSPGATFCEVKDAGLRISAWDYAQARSNRTHHRVWSRCVSAADHAGRYR